VLDVIVRRESSSRSESGNHGSWGHYVGVRDEWGVTEEEAKEVSVEVRPIIEDSIKSSTCRCCISLHSSRLIYGE
jgi:hypothetical protein